MRQIKWIRAFLIAILLWTMSSWNRLSAAESVIETIKAGTAKADITDYDAGPVNDPLFVKALVLQRGEARVVLLTVDAVAIGEIGRIGNNFLPSLRRELENRFGIEPQKVLVNASHCHGVIQSKGLVEKTATVVGMALKNLEPVTVGVGVGHENRVQENRRLYLKSGKVIDVRHAYSLPDDEQVAGVGPIDPEIGILRLDRMDGSTKAVLYQFACHPIQGVPGGANTADLTGYASRVIESAFGDRTMAFFFQGCGGDINPIDYKDVHHPRHAEVLGNRLGLSTVRAARKIICKPTVDLQLIVQTMELPRGDRTERIRELEANRQRLVNSLRGTSLNFKNAANLLVKYGISGEYPSANAHRYLQEKKLGQENLSNLDRENLRNLKVYLQNVQTMEQITRLNTNINLLRKHQASLVASGSRTIQVEVGALRVGGFYLLTFPGELTVQIGLNLKKKSAVQPCFVSGYTNGYIYYCPTAEQMKNLGGAQEDSDCLLAPQWQRQFESGAIKLLNLLR